MKDPIKMSNLVTKMWAVAGEREGSDPSVFVFLDPEDARAFGRVYKAEAGADLDSVVVLGPFHPMEDMFEVRRGAGAVMARKPLPERKVVRGVAVGRLSDDDIEAMITAFRVERATRVNLSFKELVTALGESTVSDLHRAYGNETYVPSVGFDFDASLEVKIAFICPRLKAMWTSEDRYYVVLDTLEAPTFMFSPGGYSLWVKIHLGNGIRTARR